MNCKTALELIARGPDAGSDTGARSRIEEHLATCESCRRSHSNLTAALDSWRTEAAQAAIPDPTQEWFALRRQLRGAPAATASRPERWQGLHWSWLAIPAAAAVFAFAFLRSPIHPGVGSTPSPAVGGVAVRADGVEAPGGNASTMVFVDDKSGWLIVWASDSGGRSG